MSDPMMQMMMMQMMQQQNYMQPQFSGDNKQLQIVEKAIVGLAERQKKITDVIEQQTEAVMVWQKSKEFIRSNYGSRLSNLRNDMEKIATLKSNLLKVSSAADLRNVLDDIQDKSQGLKTEIAKTTFQKVLKEQVAILENSPPSTILLGTNDTVGNAITTLKAKPDLQYEVVGKKVRIILDETSSAIQLGSTSINNTIINDEIDKTSTLYQENGKILEVLQQENAETMKWLQQLPDSNQPNNNPHLPINAMQNNMHQMMMMMMMTQIGG